MKAAIDRILTAAVAAAYAATAAAAEALAEPVPEAADHADCRLCADRSTPAHPR